MQIADKDIDGYAEECGSLQQHFLRINEMNEEYKAEIFPESHTKRASYRTFIDDSFDEENPFGEWATKFELKTTDTGPLHGMYSTFGGKNK